MSTSTLYVHDSKVFQKGDYVTIALKPNGPVQDWPNSWNPSGMDPLVGKNGTIVSVSGSMGYQVDVGAGLAGSYTFPSCCLKLVSRPGVVNQTPPVAKKKRVRVPKDGPWNSAPCSHLRWQVLSFFRYKLALVRTKVFAMAPGGEQVEVDVTQIDIACPKCNTKMTLKAK